MHEASVPSDLLGLRRPSLPDVRWRQVRVPRRLHVRTERRLLRRRAGQLQNHRGERSLQHGRRHLHKSRQGRLSENCLKILFSILFESFNGICMIVHYKRIF